MLYEIALTFDPPTLGVFPSPDGNPDGAGSILLDIAGEATDQAADAIISQMASVVLGQFVPPNVADGAGEFLGTFTGGVLKDVITGQISGDSVLYDAAQGLFAAIF